jgi:hypothetical protein
LDQGEETLQPYCQGERCFCGKARRAQGRGNDLLRQPAADPSPAHELHLVQRIGLTHATSVDGRGHGRTPAVLLVISERDALIRAAVKFFPGLSNREIARRLRTTLSRYRDGRWRRECVEATCPMRHRGRLDEMLWLLLKTSDHVPSIATIRRVLGVVVSHDQ